MPSFYNSYIHFLQRRALLPWMAVAGGESVLEIGCGVGRWTRSLARAGADVVGLDLSPTMVREARRRARSEGVDRNCRFIVADTAEFALNARFDRIVGITVLQHVLDPDRFQASVERLAAHLAPDGRVVLLEVAPTRSSTRCDSPVFVARCEQTYLRAFERAGLHVVAVSGVDPAPFRTWFLPWYRSMPRPLAIAGLFGATVASIPFDVLAASWDSATSWHKVFVLTNSRLSDGKASGL
jgi:ubiquinone/menaquinone biosynthesis C-methylase UbiE